MIMTFTYSETLIAETMATRSVNRTTALAWLHNRDYRAAQRASRDAGVVHVPKPRVPKYPVSESEITAVIEAEGVSYNNARQLVIGRKHRNELKRIKRERKDAESREPRFFQRQSDGSYYEISERKLNIAFGYLNV